MFAGIFHAPLKFVRDWREAIRQRTYLTNTYPNGGRCYDCGKPTEARITQCYECYSEAQW